MEVGGFLQMRHEPFAFNRYTCQLPICSDKEIEGIDEHPPQERRLFEAV